MGDPSGEAEPRITDEAIERLRGRVGIPVKWGGRPRNTLSSVDSIRQFVDRLRRRQPSVQDPGYAERAPVGGSVGPPDVFPVDRVAGPIQWTDEQAEAMSAATAPGIGQYLSSERWASFVR